METIRQIQKKYCTRAMMLAISFSLVFILIGQKPIGKGLILGTFFSILNFILMGKTLPMWIGKTKRKTFFMSFGSIIFRYALLAVPLIIAIKMELFNLFAVIAGIFMVQLIILTDHIFEYFVSTRRKPLQD